MHKFSELKLILRPTAYFFFVLSFIMNNNVYLVFFIFSNIIFTLTEDNLILNRQINNHPENLIFLWPLETLYLLIC